MATPFRFFILTFILLATLTSVTFVHGLWTERWAVRGADHDHWAVLEKLPLKVGAWEGTNIKPKASDPMESLQDSLQRRYVNQSNGDVMNIMLTRGMPGPMVIKHLPTECYISAGYELVGQPRRFITKGSEGGTTDEFWFATFKKTNEVIPLVVRVYWSWSATGQWQIPDQPRFVFAGYSTLYKLYVIRPLLNENEEVEGSSAHEFIHDLLQALRSSIFGPANR